MASQSATDSTSGSSLSSLPPTLTFLISNFQSFVTIRLESSNYFAWKTQVENALKANELFDFVDNSLIIPASHSLDTNGVKIPNPEFTNWITVDRMLLSCLIATLTPSVLPHIVGSNHTFQFWNKLEEKFNLLSRSHVHDLKRKLYSLNKTGSMDQYLDYIKGVVQKLAASGHYVDDEDLIFHTLNGLRTKYDSFKQAIRTRTDSISFGTFTSMLVAEDLHIENAQCTIDPTSILVAQSSNALVPAANVPSMSYQTPGVQSSSMSSSPAQFQFPVPISPQQQFYPSSSGGNNRFNRNNFRSNRNQYPQPLRNQYPQPQPNFTSGCQICGKTNHMAHILVIIDKTLTINPWDPLDVQAKEATIQILEILGIIHKIMA